MSHARVEQLERVARGYRVQKRCVLSVCYLCGPDAVVVPHRAVARHRVGLLPPNPIATVGMVMATETAEDDPTNANTKR